MKKITLGLICILLLATACAMDSETGEMVFNPVAAIEGALSGDTSASAASAASAATSRTAFEGQLSLDFYFGQRSGTYSGEVNENGLPDGHGTFTASNADGTSWTYDGDWINGHFNGPGKTTWVGRSSESGTYADDYLVGEGIVCYPDGSVFVGEFDGSGSATGTIAIDGVTYQARKDNGPDLYVGSLAALTPSSEVDEALYPFQGTWVSTGSGGDGPTGMSFNGDIAYLVYDRRNDSGKLERSVSNYRCYFNADGVLVLADEYGTEQYSMVHTDDLNWTVFQISDPDTSWSFVRVTTTPNIPDAALRDPEVGMTADEVRASAWGSPSSTESSETNSGVREQWIYEFGKVYLENGVVTLVQS